MEKFYRYIYYLLTASVVVFAALYVWVYLNFGQYSRADITVVNQEIYDIHLEILAMPEKEPVKIFKGSIKQNQTKLIEKFTYGKGKFKIILNKKLEFLIGDFEDNKNFAKTLIIKDNNASFATQ